MPGLKRIFIYSQATDKDSGNNSKISYSFPDDPECVTSWQNFISARDVFYLSFGTRLSLRFRRHVFDPRSSLADIFNRNNFQTVAFSCNHFWFLFILYIATIVTSVGLLASKLLLTCSLARTTIQSSNEPPQHPLLPPSVPYRGDTVVSCRQISRA